MKKPPKHVEVEVRLPLKLSEELDLIAKAAGRPVGTVIAVMVALQVVAHMARLANKE